MLRTRRTLLPLLLVAILAGCGGSKGSDPVPDDVGRAADRLQGEWVLTAFQPAQQLEPMLATLLVAQIDKLTVTLRAGAMSVRGVGVQADRSYRIVQATEIGFSMEVTDPAGGTYQVTGEFQGLDLAFRVHTDPWRGTGRLHRVR
jgi:hypothetical protein